MVALHAMPSKSCFVVGSGRGGDFFFLNPTLVTVPGRMVEEFLNANKFTFRYKRKE